MDEAERKEKMDALQRYEEARREQLGGAINLLFGLATAATGFCIAHAVDKDSEFSTPGSCYFVSATIVFIITVALCILATWTRLRDFRLTARKLRGELRGMAAAELDRLDATTDSLGTWTWRLFYAQLITFPIGVGLLAVSLCYLYSGHVFPKPTSPNHALQRTAPRVTLAAADHPATCAHPAPATLPQPARRTPQSLSLGSFGDIARLP